MGGDLVYVAKTEFELNISLYDESLRRNGLHRFFYQERQYSREPHVKVDDNTTPDRVGRIYFALDDKSKPARVIVDHIGVKLSPYVKR